MKSAIILLAIASLLPTLAHAGNKNANMQVSARVEYVCNLSSSADANNVYVKNACNGHMPILANDYTSSGDTVAIPVKQIQDGTTIYIEY